MAQLIKFAAPAKEEPAPPQSIVGPVRCFGCRHEWTAEADVGVTEFECPTCATMKGRRMGVVLPKDGELWVCNCGNELFFITPIGGPLCANCGVYHRPYDDPKGAA